jgi:hypothetical protein
MPRNKDLKRIVRARMKKTGESYTAARAQITKQDYASLAGMSDDVIKAKTGRDWQRWVATLDRDGAEQLIHRDIASIVSEKYGVQSWWTQTVTVGYERIKGRRIGQRSDGTFEASKSRTFAVPVETLFNAWLDAKLRKRWLTEEIKVRTAQKSRSMRLGWPGGAIVAVGFTAKGAKSAVAIQHPKLPDKNAVARVKQEWTARFDALAEVLRE